ncbi:hypothetical protein OIE66_31050 [Nonomuraea sp. NBC_01738]|uniref:hypothetical protein n=1 Tax=Nonomuraea sp. NBC_01738 TaxID=2976003 RepID=UPI002E0E856F|nr:hypothetical protein OIE66_31050 [Nonomuraea sp. NBC_01738]
MDFAPRPNDLARHRTCTYPGVRLPQFGAFLRRGEGLESRVEDLAAFIRARRAGDRGSELWCTG